MKLFLNNARDLVIIVQHEMMLMESRVKSAAGRGGVYMHYFDLYGCTVR